MNVETFCEQFATFADAPNGVAKLREMILQLAVQGKLDTQDSHDESAANLIASIFQKLTEQGSLKLTKRNRSPTRELTHREPHELPSNWVWARFDQVATIASNLVQPKDYRDFPHVAPDNIEKGTGRLLPYQTVAEDEVQSANHRFYAGQVLYSKIRPNLSKATIVDFDGLCSADMYPIHSHIDSGYLLLFILSQTFLNMAVRNDTRVAMPKINQEDLNRILVAVPPLAEQKRIVKKVDELLALCDELASRQTARREVRTRLVGATLDRLVASNSSGEFPTHAKRLRDNFDSLFDTPTTVPRLRQAILQLAVQGKLVSQDSKHESVQIAIERLDKARRAKIASGLLRGASQSPSVTAQILFELPIGWSWVFPEQISGLVNNALSIGPFGSNLVKSDYRDSGVPLVFVADVTSGFSRPARMFIDETKARQLWSHSVEPGDLVITKMGCPPGDPAIYPMDRPRGIVTADCIKWTIASELVVTEFISLMIRSPLIVNQIVEITKGAAHQKISLKRFRGIRLPLPPLAEQKRIVSKVTGLMSLCDTLEHTLTQAESASSELLSSAVSQLLCPAI